MSKKPVAAYIQALVRDGQCFFCRKDEGMYTALTPMTEDGRIHPTGKALYLCDECFAHMMRAVVTPEFCHKVKTCKKCHRTFSWAKEQCSWCQLPLVKAIVMAYDHDKETD